MKDNQGGSILSLVIGIILFLVLGGITLVMLTGDNGLFSEKTDATKEVVEKKAKEEINEVLSSIQEEAKRKITDNPEINLINEYKEIDLKEYGITSTEGYSVTKSEITIEDNKIEKSAISSNGIIEIKYNNDKLGISVSGAIDFKIKGNDIDEGSTYGTITKAQ